jgi:uncharacterized protein (UPF0335 family)
MARQPIIDTESVAQDQIRAFVERIMRMREEARAINDDIREIYAEAKGNGFDKTVLGKIVLYVERREKDAASVLEAEALFDLYLAAIDGGKMIEGAVGTQIATHAHEPISEPAHPAAGSSGETPEPTEEVAHPASSVTLPQPTAAELALRLRPFCLHSADLSQCAGQGKKHCHACLKAHADDVGEAA